MKHIGSTVRRWIRSATVISRSWVKKIRNRYPARKTWKYLSEQKEPETWLILTGRSLGDVVYGLSCMEDFCREHPTERIEVVADSRYRELVDGYEHVDKRHYLSADSRDFLAMESLLMSAEYIKKAYEKRIILTIPMVFDPYARESRKTSLEIVWEKLYRVKEPYHITYPSYPEGTVSAIPDFEKEKQRIIVLNPYSTSLACTEFEIFENIAEFLKGQGYLVYTNVLGKQKEIRGTQRLECSIGEFYRIAARIPMLVSIRSGILDYVIGSGVPIFAIYLFQYRNMKKHMETMHLFAKMFDLSAWKTGNFHQCIYENEEQTMQEFLAYFEEVVREP